MLAGNLALAVASLTLVVLVGSVSALPLEEIIRQMQPDANPNALEGLIDQADDKQTRRPEFGDRSVEQLERLIWGPWRREQDCTKEEHENLVETCKDIEEKGALFYVIRWCRLVAQSMLVDCGMNEGISVRYCLSRVDRDERLTQFERRVNTLQSGTPRSAPSIPFELAVHRQWIELPQEERDIFKEICRRFKDELNERVVSRSIGENPIVKICDIVIDVGARNRQ
jgi:hypothetical protein